MLRSSLTGQRAVLLLALMFGAQVGAATLDDNSMLVHLRTGMDMFPFHGVPDVDPYSFTALGQPWTVQSWLAEWLYGLFAAVGGLRAVVVLNVVLAAATALIIARLATSSSAARTALATACALAVGIPLWSPRPLLFGFLAFALLVLVVRDRRSPYWLIPLVYVWVNTHGSFPVGLGWLVLVIAGTALERHHLDRSLLRYVGAFLVGLVVAAINPVGPSLLWFWTSALGSGNAAFGAIVEWSSPDFHSLSGALLLAGIAVSVVVVTRGRASWPWLLPAAALLVATLWSVRYGAFYSVALAPLLGQSLKGEVGSGRGFPLLVKGAVWLAVLGSAAALTVVAIREPVNLASYPTAALATLPSDTRPTRILTQDWVGCYRIFQAGSSAGVFIDDRYDMYPQQVARDYLDLTGGRGAIEEILARYHFDAVVWERHRPVENVLLVSPEWYVAYQDTKWSVFLPRT